MRTTRGIRVSALVLALVATLIAGCARREELRGLVPPQPLTVGGLSLPEVRADGTTAPFALTPPSGRWHVVYFGYASCPDVCPTTLSDLRAALKALGDTASAVEVAFITVDMARDSAAALGPYVRSFLPNGHPLRPASQDQLAGAERAFGASSMVTRDANGRIEVTHTAVGYVVDDRGRVRVEWSFGTPSADMTHDLRVLLAAKRGAP